MSSQRVNRGQGIRPCRIVNAIITSTIVAASLLAGNAVYAGSAWTNDLQSYASRSLDSDHALSVAAVPLNGPGQAQYLNADTPMSPGSIIKVVTTYAALELLGPNYSWNTDLLSEGKLSSNTLKGDLYVRFGGDPKLTVERLRTLIDDFKGMGIKHIEGDLVLDGSYFQLSGDMPVFDDKGGNPYAPFLVEPSPYLSNLNLQRFQVVADERGLRAWSTPKMAGVSIDNKVRFASSGHCPRRNKLTWEPVYKGQQVSVRISGQLPRNCHVDSYLSLLPQQRYSATLIRSVLAQAGVSISGKDRSAATPAGARRLLRTTSPDLASTVRDINKWSNNVIARQLLLNIGAKERKQHPEQYKGAGQDDRIIGLRAIHNWLANKGIDSSSMVLENGAGLTRHGRISARLGVQILQQAWASPYASDLLASLPIIAMDGTMARRLRDTGLKGQGRIKTGSLNGVRSIAGFSRDGNGTTWAVVGIVNNDPAWNGRAVLDRVLYSLFQHPPVDTRISHQHSLDNTTFNKPASP
ncbi:MAG: D-alanyl-D-alanine carboxypeptidase/D-alanyl-D-alanine-endopeptidase [Parahaliea sp.]